ncbi:MAG: ParB/RepB/Spo0J family partition protein [Rickettsiales bacterium]|jgi:ParB family chromosome partitioning protein|nr:ParB/RepB/Spo0J family partition protein [Rickettsiales bacterium]
MIENKKFGKGLSSLLGDRNFSLVGTRSDIDVDKITANSNQPRKNFDDESMAELVESVKKYGILQPILVRKLKDNYEIVAGERRYRAARLANLKTIPAIVREFDDVEAFSLSIVENVQRKDLNPIEEAEAYRYLADSCGYSQQEIAEIANKSRSHVTNLMRLLNLPAGVKQQLLEGKIDMGHARALIGCAFADKIVNHIIDDGLSVRDVEKLVKKEKTKLPAEKVRKSTADLVEARVDELSKKTGLKCRINYDEENDSGTIGIKFNSLEQLDDFINKF